MKTTHLLAFLCAHILSTGHSADVAVSIRYLHPKSKSHAAIFLFQSDGKLVRQLTAPTDSQDVNPAFAPDGKSLIFTSESDKNAKRVLVSLDLAEKTTRVLDGEPPAWFKDRVIAKPFDDEEAPAADAPAADTPDAKKSDIFPTADGAYAIVLKPRKGTKAEPADPDERDAFLRVGKKPVLIPFTKMPGFVSFWMLHTAGSPFPAITEPRIAIFDGSHDSTNGTQFYALDLARQRIVQLSLNGGALFPWPGHPGFLCESQSRYEDLGDGRTVNCNYLDLYDAKLERTRFGHALGRFEGASVFVPGEKPFNIVDPEFTR